MNSGSINGGNYIDNFKRAAEEAQRAAAYANYNQYPKLQELNIILLTTKILLPTTLHANISRTEPDTPQGEGQIGAHNPTQCLAVYSVLFKSTHDATKLFRDTSIPIYPSFTLQQTRLPRKVWIFEIRQRFTNNPA